MACFTSDPSVRFQPVFQRSRDVANYLKIDGAGVRAEIPIAATDALYYRRDGDAITISDDLRELCDGGSVLDEAGIWSLLQFGTVIPPFSPWKQIQRVVPGRPTVFEGSPARVKEFPAYQSADKLFFPWPRDEQISLILNTLDEIILRYGRDNRLIIFFSGGVDSGLLAARAAALGLRETVLANLSFGPDDPESLLAESMAKHLGLEFIRIADDGSDVEQVLGAAGRLYREPFCDDGVLPAYTLMRAVAERFDAGVVFEGTGADSSFANLPTSTFWRHLHSLPFPVREFCALAHKAGKLWRYETGMEQRLLKRRKAAYLPYPLSSAAQNPLSGIAYRAPKDVGRRMLAPCVEWFREIASEDLHAQLVAMDLSMMACGVPAQKSRSLFDSTKLRLAFPFFSPEIQRLAFTNHLWPGAENEPKWALKAALAAQVPPEMVYRPKSGFAGPMKEKLRHPAFLGALDRLCEPGAVLGPFIVRDFFKALRPLILAGKRIPSQTSNVLWAAVYMNQWLEQVRSAARDRKCASSVSSGTA